MEGALPFHPVLCPREAHIDAPGHVASYARAEVALQRRPLGGRRTSGRSVSVSAPGQTPGCQEEWRIHKDRLLTDRAERKIMTAALLPDGPPR